MAVGAAVWPNSKILTATKSTSPASPVNCSIPGPAAAKIIASAFKKVADCIELSADKVESINWLPSTCAYRLRHEGEPLPEWHPLVSGNPESVHEAGISVSGRVISEAHVHPDSIEEHIIYWVD